jgi:hypothetical protein
MSIRELRPIPIRIISILELCPIPIRIISIRELRPIPIPATLCLPIVELATAGVLFELPPDELS